MRLNIQTCRFGLPDPHVSGWNFQPATQFATSRTKTLNVIGFQQGVVFISTESDVRIPETIASPRDHDGAVARSFARADNGVLRFRLNGDHAESPLQKDRRPFSERQSFGELG